MTPFTILLNGPDSVGDMWAKYPQAGFDTVSLALL